MLEEPDVSVIATLLKELPAAAHYRAPLEALQDEIERLRAENARLKDELAQFIDRWETLDGDALDALLYLAREPRGTAQDIAQHYRINIQIAETYLGQLSTLGYVQAHANGGAPHFELLRKGRWYLQERGLACRGEA
jgi:hypothetical protein